MTHFIVFRIVEIKAQGAEKAPPGPQYGNQRGLSRAAVARLDGNERHASGIIRASAPQHGKAAKRFLESKPFARERGLLQDVRISG
jgi:hypothetical protein